MKMKRDPKPNKKQYKKKDNKQNEKAGVII